MRCFMIVPVVALGLFVAAPAWAEPTSAASPPAASESAEPQRHGGMWQKADTDSNGIISKAEFLTQAEANFARMDKNSDGQLTQDERPRRHQREQTMGGQGNPSMHPMPPVQTQPAPAPAPAPAQ